MADITELKTEKQLVEEFRKEARESLDLLCVIIDKAQAYGVTLQFQLGRNSYGRSVVQNLDLIKVL